jgi:hypothetical protein
MRSCFRTHTGVAQQAKIRADPARYRAEFARLRTPWNDASDEMFVSDLAADRRTDDRATADIVTRDVVNETYDRLMDWFSTQMGIPAPSTGAHWWQRRRGTEPADRTPIETAADDPEAERSPL